MFQVLEVKLHIECDATDRLVAWIAAKLLAKHGNTDAHEYQIHSKSDGRVAFIDSNARVEEIEKANIGAEMQSCPV